MPTRQRVRKMSKRRKKTRHAAKAAALQLRQWRSFPADTRAWVGDLALFEAAVTAATAKADAAIAEHACMLALDATRWSIEAQRSVSIHVAAIEMRRAVAGASLALDALATHLERQPPGIDPARWRSFVGK